ncbi:MAG: glycosyltransferase family 4 protein [Chitinophagaceae bacterium]|nr:glycosyltransferase family 4 protein [Chitinophagaceae bacterium]
MKKRILIFYDHFYPAWKAGGPVQSLVNLVRQLYADYELYVICKPHEMNEQSTLPGISVNKWMDWERKAKVYYRDYAGSNHFQLKELIASVNPDTIFINGLFSLHFNIRPLQHAVAYCKQHPNCRLILSARGMLHPGALSQKSFKKKIFLAFFKLAGWHKAVYWHATDEQELQYIKQQFGETMNVLVAGNFPNLLPAASMPVKKANELILGTIALISPMKNHVAVLNVLQKSTAAIQWHIYGPVKDAAYWKECEAIIAKLPENIQVKYHGELSPADKTKAMEQFQVFIMPSKSENFGHALLEALSAGKPVITTNTTPFKHLQDVHAGFTAEINRLDEDLSIAIEKFAAMNDVELTECSKAAAVFGANFVDVKLITQQYEVLFKG